MSPSEYREFVVDKICSTLRELPGVKAIWAGGSAANQTVDDFSDIDINLLSSGPEGELFDTVEEILRNISPFTHIYHEPKSIWPELTQKVYFLENSPKHFFVDVAYFPESADEILMEFMQRERHGEPVVFYDPAGKIKSIPTNQEAMHQKHLARYAELLGSFPIMYTEIVKEIDRDHPIDAMGFYQGGVIRKLVEMLGILHRPNQFDFNLRYIKRSFPEKDWRKIQSLLYVSNAKELKTKAEEAKTYFNETTKKVEKVLKAT